VRYLRSAQLGDLVQVNIGANGQLRLLGYSDTIGSLTGSGIVELLAGTLTTGNNPSPTTYAGVISGIGGNLTKVGSGMFTLTGNNAYTGTTFVKGGTLTVNGQQPNSDVSIQTGGALSGNGTVGNINDQTGHVKPGATTCGALKCATLTTLAAFNRSSSTSTARSQE
jgi:fibronectin-binding autotransporter adhesin